MQMVSEGSSLEVTVPAGRVLRVTTSGTAYIDRVSGLPDAGYASDLVDGGMRTLVARSLPYTVRVRAVHGSAEVEEGYPDVDSSQLDFRRDEYGVITKMVDRATGETIQFGGDGSVSWADINGKPVTFPPAIGTTSSTAKAGDYTPSWGEIESKPAVIASGDTQAAARISIGALPEADKGTPSGVAPLDASGIVPLEHLNVSGLTYLGAWDASTNTPELLDGAGSVGDFHKVTTAGTQDFGSGSYTFGVGDWVIYAAGTWQRVGVHEAVSSVGGKTGAVPYPTPEEIGALPDTYTPSWDEITDKPNIDSALPGSISAPIPAVLAYKTSNQPTTQGSSITINWEAVAYDQFSMHQNASDFVVPEWASHLRATGIVVFDGNEGGWRRAGIRINGAIPPGAAHDQGGNVGSFDESRKVVTGVVPVQPGDVVTVEAHQTLGDSTPIESNGNSQTWLQIELYTTS